MRHTYRVSCSDLWCDSFYRKTRLYHSLGYAVSIAEASNRMLGRKARKVVMIRGHLAVVDHTWERNN